MAEPIKPELIQPQRLTIGETPVYLTTPMEVDGEQVTQVTIKGAGTRAAQGPDSAVLLLKHPSLRRGEEGQTVAKPLTNINDMEEVVWDEKIDGLSITMSDGSTHVIPRDQISLVRPLASFARPGLAKQEPAEATPAPEPKLARGILEQYSGTPTTLTIVGLKAYETRAHDLADKAMQLKTSLGERVWKQGFGPVYFHEKLRQYYLDMLKASNTPFAAQSIKIAEAAATNSYQDLLKDTNFLARAGRRFAEWLKSNLGMRTMVQRFALEEIAAMGEAGQIRERETFEREAGSIRKRFEMDVDNQDAYIRKTLGEDLRVLDRPEHQELVGAIKSLVRTYASGEIATKQEFDGAADALFHTHLKSAHPDLFNQAELYTSSLYEVAETLRTRAGHEGGLAAIDAQIESMQVRLGMGVMGEATALEPTDVQRGTEMFRSLLTKLEKKGIVGPFLFNEATVSAGVAAALSLAVLPKMGVSTLARGIAGPLGGLAVGGLFGGWREYRMLEREYLTHTREREAGLTFSPDAKRRAWMERFFVGQRSADDLIGILTKPAETPQDLQLALATLADAKARKALSARAHERNRQRVGLIQFSAREHIESERTALDLTIAQAEKALVESGKVTQELLADLTAAQTRVLNEGMDALAGLDDPIRTTLGLLEKYNPQVDVMRRRFPLLGPDVSRGKAQGLEDILKEFRRAARGEAVKKGLVVGATAGVVGLGLRAGVEAGEAMLGIGQEAAVSGAETGGAILGHTIDGHSVATSEALAFDGEHFDLVDPATKTVLADNVVGAGDLQFLPDGGLTRESVDMVAERLHALGWNVDATGETLTAAPSSGTHLLEFGIRAMKAPNELHWVDNGDGTRRLVLDVLDASGAPKEEVIVGSATLIRGEPDDPTAVLRAIEAHPLLAVTPDQAIPLPAEHGTIPGMLPITDAAGNDHLLPLTLPKGMTLEPVENLRLEARGIYTFDLMNRDGTTLIEDVNINARGDILNAEALNLTEGARLNHVEFSVRDLAPIEVPKATDLGAIDLKVSEMGPAGEAQFPWRFLAQHMEASDEVAHTTPATNLAKNLFRGYVENVQHAANVEGLSDPSALDYTRLQPDMVFKDMPVNLFGDAQLVELGKLMDEAINKFEVDGVSFRDFHPLPPVAGEIPSHDYILKLAYDVGRVGRVPTESEVEAFLAYMGRGTETVIPHEVIITQSEVVPGEIIALTEPLHRTILTAMPPGEAGEFDPFVLPIPILWRRPLEPYVPLAPYPPPEIPPGELPPFAPLPRPEEERPAPFLAVPYGGPEAGEGRAYGRPYGPKYPNEEILAYYRQRRHPELLNNPASRLDFETAARWYVSEMPEAYRQALEALDRTITVPMHDETRIAVCIPVAAHEEGNNIYHTLEQYTKQTLPADQYEVLLFLNIPQGTEPDKTLAEVQRFMADHPDMPVRVATGNFPPGTVRFGAYIKYAYDLALLRALKRQNPAAADLLIATADSDLEAIDPDYLAVAVERMSGPDGEKLDAMLTLLDFDNQALDAFPTMKAAARFGQYIEHQMHQNETPYVQTSGAVSILRGSTLAAIGGVNPSTPAGADIEIGRMIHYARHGRTHHIPKSDYTVGYTNTVGVRTNARRQVFTMLTGRPLTAAWEQFDEGEEIRSKTTPELIAAAEPRHRTLSADGLAREINSYRAWDVAMDSPEVRQALSWMGLSEGTDYVVEGDPQWGGKPGIRFISDLSDLAARINTLAPTPPTA